MLGNDDIPSPEPGKKYRNWFFTGNAYTTLPTMLPQGATYMVCQQEVGGTTGHLHLQGCIRFKSPRALSGLKKSGLNPDPGCEGWDTHNWSVARNWDACVKYCQKMDTRAPGTMPVILGDEPKGQGKRTDLEDYHQALDKVAAKAMTLKDAAKQCFTAFLKYPAGTEKYLALHKEGRQPGDPLDVVLLVGESETGKTVFASTILVAWGLQQGYRGVYEYTQNKDLWWQDYDDQEIIIINEFSGKVFPFTLFNQMMDPRTLSFVCGVKGSSRKFNGKLVIITSNFTPSEWYTSESEIANRHAIIRRLKYIVTFYFNQQGQRIRDWTKYNPTTRAHVTCEATDLFIRPPWKPEYSVTAEVLDDEEGCPYLKVPEAPSPPPAVPAVEPELPVNMKDDDPDDQEEESDQDMPELQRQVAVPSLKELCKKSTKTTKRKPKKRCKFIDDEAGCSDEEIGSDDSQDMFDDIIFDDFIVDDCVDDDRDTIELSD